MIARTGGSCLVARAGVIAKTESGYRSLASPIEQPLLVLAQPSVATFLFVIEGLQQTPFRQLIETPPDILEGVISHCLFTSSFVHQNPRRR